MLQVNLASDNHSSTQGNVINLNLPPTMPEKPEPTNPSAPSPAVRISARDRSRIAENEIKNAQVDATAEGGSEISGNKIQNGPQETPEPKQFWRRTPIAVAVIGALGAALAALIALFGKK